MTKEKILTYEIEGRTVLYKEFSPDDVEVSILGKDGTTWSIYKMGEAYRTIKILQDVLRANDPDYEEKMIAMMSEEGEEIK